MNSEDEELRKILDKKFRELAHEVLSRDKGKKRSLGGLIFEANDNDFNEKVIKRSKETPVIVDFWAEWCAPCLMLAPILESVVKEFNGSVLLAKVNVDRNPILTSKFGIMSIPTVAMFKDGKLVDYFIGVIPPEAVRRWIKRNLT